MSTDSTTTPIEQVDVLTAGGVVSIDLTAAIEAGYINGETAETTGNAVAAVRSAINADMSLPTIEGGRALITGSVAAIIYRRV